MEVLQATFCKINNLEQGVAEPIQQLIDHFGVYYKPIVDTLNHNEGGCFLQLQADPISNVRQVKQRIDHCKIGYKTAFLSIYRPQKILSDKLIEQMQNYDIESTSSNSWHHKDIQFSAKMFGTIFTLCGSMSGVFGLGFMPSIIARATVGSMVLPGTGFAAGAVLGAVVGAFSGMLIEA